MLQLKWYFIVYDFGYGRCRFDLIAFCFFLSVCLQFDCLQLSEWLEAKKQLDFIDRDYASRLDLIAKVRGLQKAEYYIQSVPKSFRGEVIYRTLLANCVAAYNLKKAEEVFNKMKDLEFPITLFV